MKISIQLGTLVAALLISIGGYARAQDGDADGIRHGKWSAALTGGTGAQLADKDEGAIGPEAGVRAGYTRLDGLYLGGQAKLFGAHFATKAHFEDDPGNEILVRKDLTDGLTIGVEGGYALQLGPVTVRPSVVLGLGLLDYGVGISGPGGAAELPARGGSHFLPALYVAPGASLLIPIGPLFAGVDPRFGYLLGEKSHTTLSILGVLGLTL